MTGLLVLTIGMLVLPLHLILAEMISERSQIASFKVMDVLARAIEIESTGSQVCHMEAGQPSTNAPSKVIEEALRAVQHENIGYTNAIGILPLRQAIAKHYLSKYEVEVSPEQVIITTGSSAAFLFAFLGCFDHGDCVALCSSGYPCYRNLMKATNLNPISIPMNNEFKITAKELMQAIERRKELKLPPIKGLILSSPSNPTGAMLSDIEMEELCKVCISNGILFISDEIYHGISYGNQKEVTALSYSKSAIVINSFSKYYSMTGIKNTFLISSKYALVGWRLGWMIVPPSLVSTMNRLSQNMYINAPTLSQIAAVKAFECNEELDKLVEVYRVNRQCVLDTLAELNILDVSPADGAFYVYADLSKQGITDTMDLCKRYLVVTKL